MRTLLLAVVMTAALTGPGRAEPVTDALFAEGIFDAVPDGQVIAYSHSRKGVASAAFTPVIDGRMVVVTGKAADGTRSVSLKIDTEGQRREVSDFPASGGNPVLMVFLESTVRSMAAMSGGSPFYIRNRIKDALREGGDLTDAPQDFAGRRIAAQELVLRPFDGDPNRDRMGEFAGLSLRFVVSDAVPGRFLLMSADTPEAGSGYHETITLTDTEDAP